MNIQRVERAIMSLAYVALFCSLALLARAQAPSDSPVMNNLFTEVKLHSSQVEADAEILESYTRSPVSWQSHARQLEIIKEHVNNLIRDTSQMSSLREEGSAWQQEAIDRINPLMHEMADHLTASLEHLNAEPGKVHMQPYRAYVRANFELVHKTHQLISDFADYSEAKARQAL